MLTEPYQGQQQRVMKYQTTDRDLPLIVLQHPIQSANEEALDSRAEELADAAERLLKEAFEE
jgi:hypothetical protein